ncbi:hypothetical protein ACFS27_01815 [Promicromonospora vindobonensis]|uniref:DUF308 domain-containing protein n=1 Tax=Promicromonospora vindobonensis TaxID=195748 RepID=A0ABW5VMU6_9MICO
MAASNTDDRDDDVPGDTPRELGDDDVASRWADIVATLGDIDVSRADGAAADPEEPAESSQTSRSDDEGAAGDRPDDRADDRTGARADDRADDTADGEQSSAPRVILPAGPRDWPLSPESEALEEEDSHFTPPVPPPLLSRDPLLTMAWSFVVGVPTLALVGMVVSAAMPSVAIPPLVGQIGVGLFVAGLGVLIWRMPHQRDPDDDGPGAVV